MKNPAQPQHKSFFWCLYSTSKRGWLALIFLVLSLCVTALFMHPDFSYRDHGAPDVICLQLSFKASKFKAILAQWRDISLFKETVWKLDFIFPISYAGSLAFAFAWIRRNLNPTRLDRIFFLAPMVAASCDCIENSIHLYLLRNVSNKAQAEAANFSRALVFAASFFASLKLFLLALVGAAILILLGKEFVRNFRRDDSNHRR